MTSANDHPPIGPGQWAQIACIYEATARKPGNVHRFADFDDATYLDFLLSASAIAPVLDRAPDRPLGLTILEAVQATRGVAPSNTNLGLILMLSPLAALPIRPEEPCTPDRLRDLLRQRLDATTTADTAMLYEAIRLAQPGGLGEAPKHDVNDRDQRPPDLDLRGVMALAAEHDAVARQYVTDYLDVFEIGLPTLREHLECPDASVETAIVTTHLRLMVERPDTLIARKRGAAIAAESADRARAVLRSGWPDRASSWSALGSLDAWLRADGRGRNPGATADLVAATLAIAIRCQHLGRDPVGRPRFAWTISEQGANTDGRPDE